jgi:type I restriction enzyme S subunit
VKRRSQNWEATTLGEHVDIQTGFPFKSQRYVDDADGIRLLRGDNIVQGALRWEGVKKWTSAERHDYGRYELRADDVVLAMDRPWIEAGLKYAWISEHDLPCLLVQRVSRLRGSSRLCTNYIRYLIGHHSFTDYLKGIWTGIAVPHISESQIRAFKILLPPVPVQERIIGVLSAYDDLIENNTRRVKILEDMAQMLYREWFVNFRFPGHENVRMVESELGPIPEGWTATKLGQILTLEYGKALKDADRHGGPVPVFGSSGIVGYHSKKLIDGPGIIVGRKGNVGSVFYCQSDYWVIDTAYSVKSGLSRLYLYFNLRAQNFLNNDAAVPGLNRNQAHSLPVVVPEASILESFDRMAQPMFDLKRCLQSRNTNLRTTRDLLLPKLISGEIPVEAADDYAAELGEQRA